MWPNDVPEVSNDPMRSHLAANGPLQTVRLVASPIPWSRTILNHARARFDSYFEV